MSAKPFHPNPDSEVEARPRQQGAAALAILLSLALGAALLTGPPAPRAAKAAGKTAPPRVTPAAPVIPGTTLTAPPPEIEGPPGAPIGAVVIEGLQRVDSSMVLRKLGLRPGERLSAERARAGLRALYDLGYFSDLQLDADTLEDGAVALTLTVRERPTAGGIEFRGNKAVDTSKLKTATGLTIGQWVDDALLEAEASKLREYYRNEGYAQAKITARLVPPESRVPTVVFDIQEGRKVRIQSFAFSGIQAFDAGTLRKQLKSHAHGFLRSGTYKPEQLEEDAGRVGSYYRDHGYRDVLVHTPTIAYDTTGANITVNFQIEEGPLEHFGISRWAGGAIFPDSVLGKFLTYKPGEVYSEGAVRKSLEGLYAAYQERGYIYVSIDPQMGTRDHTVDLQYAITEGRPAHLHEVKVAGNTRTKEKVIRREVTMHQGDLFRRSAVQRSQRDVFSLGLFSDVQIDYQPPPGDTAASDVDLTFKVAEKQTGTASMGAGYSSSTGLTGFADLGHKNIFGGGQSVNLHLERGGSASNYELSYTEPYFRDTPTSVGFDIYNTLRNSRSASISSVSTHFDQKRRGAALTLGRPLGFIDYSRVSVTYRLEDVTLQNFILDSVTVCDKTVKASDGKTDSCVQTHR